MSVFGLRCCAGGEWVDGWTKVWRGEAVLGLCEL